MQAQIRVDIRQALPMLLGFLNPVLAEEPVAGIKGRLKLLLGLHLANRNQLAVLVWAIRARASFGDLGLDILDIVRNRAHFDLRLDRFRQSVCPSG